MKIVITLKDPDALGDAVYEAVRALDRPAGVSAEEWAYIRIERRGEVKADITDRWMKWGEYVTIEFDTEAKTATVLAAVK